MFALADTSHIDGGLSAQADKRRVLELRVANDGWGNARIQDIETVLQSVGRELLPYFPDPQLSPIVVEPGESAPMVLYRTDLYAPYVVRLTARNKFWSQYAYQFSHELGHILANYDGPGRHPSVRWFDEAIAETASLFVLRRMAETWSRTPPYPNWRDYAQALSEYVEDLTRDSRRRLPPRTTLGQWFVANRARLAADPVQRELNAVVANELLPMFERNPANWDAITYLNNASPGSSQFEDHLENWRMYASSRYQPFIASIIARFRD